MTPEAALAIAKATEPATEPRRPRRPERARPGAQVVVSSEDLPQSRFPGECWRSPSTRSILRHDPACGRSRPLPAAGYRRRRLTRGGLGSQTARVAIVSVTAR
jgi:hypothetical protein